MVIFMMLLQKEVFREFVVICDAIKSIYSLFKPKQNKKLLKIALSVFEEKLDLRKSIFSLCTL
jgi:hypothetical protein